MAALNTINRSGIEPWIMKLEGYHCCLFTRLSIAMRKVILGNNCYLHKPMKATNCAEFHPDAPRIWHMNSIKDAPCISVLGTYFLSTNQILTWSIFCIFCISMYSNQAIISLYSTAFPQQKSLTKIATSVHMINPRTECCICPVYCRR